MKSIIAGVTFAAALLVSSVVGAQSVVPNLAKFDGGIGVIPTGSGNTAVRGVPAAGQIWVIDDLRATVKVDGRIRVNGRGLIFGAGNNVGRATGQNVIATLICETAAPFVRRNTGAVPLADNGDFRINDVLTPGLPAICDDPRLLIRNASGDEPDGAGGWFAAGITKFEAF